jgi:hypothetical protein
MKGVITTGQSVQFTGNYLPCNISLIDVWFLVICRLYGNLHRRELGPAMRSNGPLAQVLAYISNIVVSISPAKHYTLGV